MGSLDETTYDTAKPYIPLSVGAMFSSSICPLSTYLTLWLNPDVVIAEEDERRKVPIGLLSLYHTAELKNVLLS